MPTDIKNRRQSPAEQKLFEEMEKALAAEDNAVRNQSSSLKYTHDEAIEKLERAFYAELHKKKVEMTKQYHDIIDPLDRAAKDRKAEIRRKYQAALALIRPAPMKPGPKFLGEGI